MIEIGLVLALMVAVMVLFSLEAVSVDLVALGVLVVLLLARILTPAEALAGFGSEVVIVIGGLFVLTAGLRRTGAIDQVGRWLLRKSGGQTGRLVALLLITVLSISGFMNNTTTTAVFLPVAIGFARRSGLAPSKLLMPLAFASILGGTLTLIGTSTNVIVSGMLPRYGLAPIGMFELSPVGLPLALFGLVYLLLAARRLLPSHPETELAQEYHIRDYTTEVVIPSGSPLVGQSIGHADLGGSYDLNLIALVRGGELVMPSPREQFRGGDVLLVNGALENLLKIRDASGIEIHSEVKAAAVLEHPTWLVEAIVMPGSELIGRTLQEVQFRQRYGINVIALNRHAEALREKVGKTRIRVGDVLLIQGRQEAVDRLLARRRELMLLSSVPQQTSMAPRRALMATGIFALVIALATAGAISMPGAVLAGALLLFLTKCLTPEEAYASIDWRMLVLIAGMIGYGQAMEKTGTAAFLAGHVLTLMGGFGPTALIAGFYVLTLMLTQPMSNQAAALVVLPVALQAALEAGIDPRAMAMTVALAASSSFLTPLEPSCLLVYGPGRYRFLDFVRFGSGLTLIAFLLTLLLVPLLWPL